MRRRIVADSGPPRAGATPQLDLDRHTRVPRAAIIVGIYVLLLAAVVPIGHLVGPLEDVTVSAVSFIGQLITVLALTFLLVLHGRRYTLGNIVIGLLGALIAIPTAAGIQIVLSDWWSYRKGEPAGGAPQ